MLLTTGTVEGLQYCNLVDRPVSCQIPTCPTQGFKNLHATWRYSFFFLYPTPIIIPFVVFMKETTCMTVVNKMIKFHKYLCLEWCLIWYILLTVLSGIFNAVVKIFTFSFTSISKLVYMRMYLFKSWRIKSKELDFQHVVFSVSIDIQGQGTCPCVGKTLHLCLK